MAVTLTRNLKLRVDSNLTSNSRYNLEKLDQLGSTFLVDTQDQLNIRSVGDILLEPESADIGGSSVGGTLRIGTASHSLDSVLVQSDEIKLSTGPKILDESQDGVNYLKLRYLGSQDSQDRTLDISVQGASRSLTLGGNLDVSGGSLVLNMTADSSVAVPNTGTLATLAGLETLTNKTINADLNSVSQIRNSNVAANAAIVYSKLSLTDGIVNNDISSSAAIQYSKLNLAGALSNSDLSPAANISYSKLNLAGNIQNTDIAALAGITYDKLDLGASIQVSDLSSTFFLDGSRVESDFGSRQVEAGSLRMQGPLQRTILRPAQLGQVSDLTFSLPPTLGSNNQVLTTDGAGNLSWTSSSGTGTVISYSENWTNGQGTTKVVTHNLGSSDVSVEIRDTQDNSIIWIQDIQVTDQDTLTLTASEAPATSWRVVIQA